MRIVSGVLASCVLFPVIGVVFFGMWDVLFSTPYWSGFSEVILLWVLLGASILISIFGALAWMREIFFHTFFMGGIALLLFAFIGWKVTHDFLLKEDDIYCLLDWGAPENFAIFQHITTITFTMMVGTVFVVFALFSDNLGRSKAHFHN